MLLVSVASTGCFATRSDLRVLQGDINTVRLEAQRAREQQAASMTQAVRLLQALSDSLLSLSQRQVNFEGDARGELRRVNEQLIAVQQLLGQSASIIRSLRAELETAARGGAIVVPDATAAQATQTPPPPTQQRQPSRAPAVQPAPVTSARSDVDLPGPNQLYQDGMDHFRRGSYASARIAFGDLLLNYPNADVAPESQYWIAEAYAAEKNVTAAETAYGAVVSKYPESPRAPDAMFKRGLLLLEQGNREQARTVLQQLIQRYPRSDAAEFAKERLTTVP
jgi:tol-pal system protein YbgF